MYSTSRRDLGQPIRYRHWQRRTWGRRKQELAHRDWASVPSCPVPGALPALCVQRPASSAPRSCPPGEKNRRIGMTYLSTFLTLPVKKARFLLSQAKFSGFPSTPSPTILPYQLLTTYMESIQRVEDERSTGTTAASSQV